MAWSYCQEFLCQADWFPDEVQYKLASGHYFLFVIHCRISAICYYTAMQKNSWLQVLLLGALFGLITYATYDLTNLATIKDWPVLVTIIDLIWGMTVAGAVSVISFFIADKIGL